MRNTDSRGSGGYESNQHSVSCHVEICMFSFVRHRQHKLYRQRKHVKRGGATPPCEKRIRAILPRCANPHGVKASKGQSHRIIAFRASAASRWAQLRGVPIQLQNSPTCRPRIELPTGLHFVATSERMLLRSNLCTFQHSTRSKFLDGILVRRKASDNTRKLCVSTTCDCSKQDTLLPAA